MVTPAVRRQAVALVKAGFQVSQRRACHVLSVSRRWVDYRSRKDDDVLRQRLKALAAERRRFGYKRLAILLRREGHCHNLKKIYRLYREEGLMVKHRKGRKRAIGTRLPLPKPDSPNQVWSLDFLSDALSDGRRFRVLGVMDQCSRECLTLVADTSIGGARVVRELDALVCRNGNSLSPPPSTDCDTAIVPERLPGRNGLNEKFPCIFPVKRGNCHIMIGERSNWRTRHNRPVSPGGITPGGIIAPVWIAIYTGRE
jgi:hypothetical protein